MIRFFLFSSSQAVCIFYSQNLNFPRAAILNVTCYVVAVPKPHWFQANEFIKSRDWNCLTILGHFQDGGSWDTQTLKIRNKKSLGIIIHKRIVRAVEVDLWTGKVTFQINIFEQWKIPLRYKYNLG